MEISGDHRRANHGMESKITGNRQGRLAFPLGMSERPALPYRRECGSDERKCQSDRVHAGFGKFGARMDPGGRENRSRRRKCRHRNHGSDWKGMQVPFLVAGDPSDRFRALHQAVRTGKAASRRSDSNERFCGSGRICVRPGKIGARLDADGRVREASLYLRRNFLNWNSKFLDNSLKSSPGIERIVFLDFFRREKARAFIQFDLSLGNEAACSRTRYPNANDGMASICRIHIRPGGCRRAPSCQTVMSRYLDPSTE